ncbi:sigma 54-interacting transcriptional regulator [Escherichia coli]
MLLDDRGNVTTDAGEITHFLNDGTFRRVGKDHEVHVDVRVICATQKNLVRTGAKGMFREALYIV